MSRTVAFIFLFLIVILVGGFLWFITNCEDDWCFIFAWQKIKHTNSFEECVARGFPILESYPSRCVAGNKSFTQTVSPMPPAPHEVFTYKDLLRVRIPKPNSIVLSPLIIEGEARGMWYFEASFPVKLLDANGKELAVWYAQAQDEWMTEEYVPFKSELTFSMPATDTGTLVLEKDNPSGLPQHADQVRIPVRFKP